MLERQFESELQDSLQRIREAIAPYTRFVRVEREKLEKLEADLDRAAVELGELRAEVRKTGSQQLALVLVLVHVRTCILRVTPI